MAANQIDTLRLMTALRLHRPVWAGSLLLGIGLNDAGRTLALASLAAGAAALLLESEEVLLREAAREGCTTFTVTTLDEALRALKNEVRQGRAITVALGGPTQQWLSEIVERGVLPQAVAATHDLSPPQAASVATLRGWGASSLSGLGLHGMGDVNLADLLPVAVGDRVVREDIAATPTERRAQDALLLAANAGDATVCEANRQWLRAAPTLFPRALSRATWTAQEADGSKQ